MKLRSIMKKDEIKHDTMGKSEIEDDNEEQIKYEKGQGVEDKI